MKRVFLFLMCLMMSCLLSTAGCANKTVLIRQSLSPVPEECKGVLYVATNQPIPVGVEGTNELLSVDVGGYYLVHKNDMAAIVKRLKKDP